MRRGISRSAFRHERISYGVLQRLPFALRLGQILTLALGARATYLTAAYLSGFAGTERHDVESAVVALVLVGTPLLLAAGNARPDGREPVAHRAVEWALWCAASVLLYWPSMSVGLLSDDFVLMERAEALRLGFVHGEFFRPLPLLVWSAVWRVAGSIGLHTVNVLAHGSVAFLSSRLAGAFVESRWRAVVAGLIVLTFPASVEAVTWISGVFDVTAALFVLAAVLAARRYEGNPTAGPRVRMGAYTVAALLCKETAIVAPAMIAVDAWARRALRRPLVIDIAAVSCVFGIVGVVRFFLASDLLRQPLSKYVVQRWAFGTVGGVALPYHQQVAQHWPWVAASVAVATVALLSAFFVGRPSQTTVRAAVASALWIFLGSLPTLPFFFVGQDLQGARYLYLPAIGYAMLLSVMAATVGCSAQVLGAGVLTLTVLGGSIGLRSHQQPWRAAADSRDRLLEAVAIDSHVRECPHVWIERIPDTVEGAYVLRNGAEIAFRGVNVVLTSDAPQGCRFQWTGERLTTAGEE